jgi:hypothetical protein
VHGHGDDADSLALADTLELGPRRADDGHVEAVLAHEGELTPQQRISRDGMRDEVHEARAAERCFHRAVVAVEACGPQGTGSLAEQARGRDVI